MAIENFEENISCMWLGIKMKYELRILLCKGDYNDIKDEACMNGIDINNIDHLKFNSTLLQSSGVPIITKFQ